MLQMRELWEGGGEGWSAALQQQARGTVWEAWGWGQQADAPQRLRVRHSSIHTNPNKTPKFVEGEVETNEGSWMHAHINAHINAHKRKSVSRPTTGSSHQSWLWFGLLFRLQAVFAIQQSSNHHKKQAAPPFLRRAVVQAPITQAHTSSTNTFHIKKSV